MCVSVIRYLRYHLLFLPSGSPDYVSTSNWLAQTPALHRHSPLAWASQVTAWCRSVHQCVDSQYGHQHTENNDTTNNVYEHGTVSVMRVFSSSACTCMRHSNTLLCCCVCPVASCSTQHCTNVVPFPLLRCCGALGLQARRKVVTTALFGLIAQRVGGFYPLTQPPPPHPS